MKIYTLDNQLIEETHFFPINNNFTGIVEYASGEKYWFFEGEKHREDGPAIEHPDGTKEWLVNGKHHRLNGPAIIYYGHYKEWFINDKQVSEQQHKLYVDIMKLKGLI